MGAYDHLSGLTVLDLFSGCGGMSYGFKARPAFVMAGAVDAQVGKPTSREGSLGCNLTYAANIGLEPMNRDIAALEPGELCRVGARVLGRPLAPGELTVLLCCPPCTDFSRTKPENHGRDTVKNTLVQRTFLFVDALRPEFLVMENAREMIKGRNTHHWEGLKRDLESIGYRVHADIYMLSDFGLPQVRERAVVIASRETEVLDPRRLWRNRHIRPGALTVRHAIGELPALEAGAMDADDPMHVSPAFQPMVRRRLEATPADGGSWIDLLDHPEADLLLIPSMKKRIALGQHGSHPDVYGRLAWDKPAVTLKRECAHVGNGRYAHPEQTRLLSVREAALLQGFPKDFNFASGSMANRYRQIGDAVPPLISYQLSALVLWMKTGIEPLDGDLVLPGASLRLEDLSSCEALAGV